MSARKYVLRTRGEATLAAAFMEQGLAEDVSLARAVRTAQFLNRCGARVCHWTEVIMAMLIGMALGVISGVFIGLAIRLAGLK